MADDPAFLHGPDHFELVYVGTHGTTTRCFGYQPTTECIAHNRMSDRYCVQKVGEIYEVYDCTTLKRFHGTWTIGLPVFQSEDPDAAIMWALMNL